MRILVTLFILIINLTVIEAQVITQSIVLNNIKCEKDHNIYYSNIDDHNYIAKWKYDEYETIIYKYSEDYEQLIDTVDILRNDKHQRNIKIFKKGSAVYLLLYFNNSLEIYDISKNIDINDKKPVFKYIIEEHSGFKYCFDKDHNLFFYYRKYTQFPNDTLIGYLKYYNIQDTSDNKSIVLDREYGVRGRVRRITQNSNGNIVFKAQSKYYQDYNVKTEIYDKKLNLLKEYEYHIDDYIASFHFLVHENVFYNIGYNLETRKSKKDKYSIAVHSFNRKTKNEYINYISADTITSNITNHLLKTNIITDNGNLIVGGFSANYLDNKPNFDYNSHNNLIVKVNPQCEIIWKYEFGKDNTFDLINHIEKLDDQNYLIITKEGNHVKLYWMRDLDVGVRDSQIKPVSVYPNPASSKLSVKSNEAVTNAKIIDISGNTVMKPDKATLRKLRTDGEATLDIENLNAGTYFLVLDDNRIKKFIVEK